jgi:regulator of sigma E protease
MLENLTDFATSTLAFIVVVGILVFVHELGHYLVAIYNRVKVETFSIGFGPELFGWNDKRGTHWRVAAIPLGGYVKMFGDVDPASMTNNGEVAKAMSPEERAGAFFAKPLGQRAAIVAAGPLINFLFAIVALFALFVWLGKPHTLPIVDGLVDGLPAQQAGILPGDRILALNDTEIVQFEDIKDFMALNLDQPIVVHVDRAGAQMEFRISPVLEATEEGSPHKIGRLGIKSQKIEYTSLGVGEAAVESVKSTWKITIGTLEALWQMVVGTRGSEELGSVISIAKMSGDAVDTESVEATIANFLWFMAVLSANLGLINLFPIPVLDGGHLVFFICEAFRGRPLGDKAQEYSLRFGLALVLTLTVFAIWNDLSNFGVVDYVSRLFL